MRKLFLKPLALVLAALLVLSAASLNAGEKITIVGGTMLPEGHVFWLTCEKFKELFEKYYDGPDDVTIDLHHSGNLGTEKDALEFMIQGTAVDFYIISPAWFATWNKTITIMDAPFLFRDSDHWEAAISAGIFAPLDEIALSKGIRVLGHGGGGIRSIISKKSASSVADFPNIRLRVQGSPLHQKAFAATGLVATPMDFMEVYNAIKTGVLDALENEPAGLEGMKFYEVAPYFILTQHQITTRQLAMSEKRFQKFPQAVQEALLKAGKEAAAYHRKTEVADGVRIIRELTEKHGLKPIEFDNSEMRRLAMPVIEEYAKEIDAYEIFTAIQNF